MIKVQLGAIRIQAQRFTVTNRNINGLPKELQRFAQIAGQRSNLSGCKQHRGAIHRRTSRQSLLNDLRQLVVAIWLEAQPTSALKMNGCRKNVKRFPTFQRHC